MLGFTRAGVAVAFMAGCLLVPLGVRAGEPAQAEPPQAAEKPVAFDLPDIQKAGMIRHLGIPYANFNSGAQDGFDVDLMKLFAKHIGVEYKYVPSAWSDVIADLTGRKVKPDGDGVKELGFAPVKGDVIATGFTVLPWRKKAVSFSSPYFPTQVWLVARSDSTLNPIAPTGKLEADIDTVKKLLKGLTVMGKAGTCLDLSLYNVKGLGAEERYFDGGLNDLAPALLKGEADILLLDVPDCLVALGKWPGKIKVIGPMSDWQEMACAFRQDSPKLLEAFETFLAQCKRDGTYLALVKKYYPGVISCCPAFFKDCIEPNSTTPGGKNAN